MLAEVLLVLSGHPSSFFVASGTTLTVTPSLSAYLHPGEVASLNTLGQLAFRYKAIKEWTRRVHDEARAGVLEAHLARGSGNGKGKGKERERDDVRGPRGGNINELVPDAYMSTLAHSLSGVIGEYEELVVGFEARVLALDPGLVQDAESYVPLSSVVAAFDEWQSIMSALYTMVVELSSVPTSTMIGTTTLPTGLHTATTSGKTPTRWTPGLLIHHLSTRRHTGHPRLLIIYTSILSSLIHLFLTHLAAFMLHGLAPHASSLTPSEPALGIDTGPDALSPQHRSYSLNTDLLPPALSVQLRESVLYVGRVAATLRREGKALPREMVVGLKDELMRVDTLDEGGGLGRAVDRARAEIGEWLWKHVLTGPQITLAIQSFGHYFLLRRADYALSVVRELHRLRLTKLVTSKPTSSTSVIREADLDIALLRASVSTSAEDDRQLESLGWSLPLGPLRPISAATAPRQPRPENAKDKVLSMFSSSVLGAPLELKARISWPLDLFMTPASVRAYTEVHAFLFALRDAHTSVLDAWTALSGAHRRATSPRSSTTSTSALERVAWSIIRAMLFFLDQLQGHFMSDIIHVQHRHLLDELDVVSAAIAPTEGSADTPTISPSASVSRNDRLGSLGGRKSWSRSSLRDLREGGDASRPESPLDNDGSRTGSGRIAPPMPGRSDDYLDFLTLRQMHTRHLQLLREGLLLTDIPLLGVIRDIIDICKRFAGLVERWGGDVSPDVQGEEGEREVEERLVAVQEVKQSFHDLFTDFYRGLLESQSPNMGKDDTSSIGTGVSKSTAGTNMSRAARTMQMSRMMGRHGSFSGGGGGGAGKFGPGTGTGSGADAGGGGGKDGRSGKKGEADRHEKSAQAEALIGRHAEQLLLRLDFNGVLSEWLALEDDGVKTRDLLAEGGL